MASLARLLSRESLRRAERSRRSTLLDPSASLGIVGLGYVGLQLAVAFARELPTVGFDIDARRIAELREGLELADDAAARDAAGAAGSLLLTCAPDKLRGASWYIIAVPTPVNSAREPDLAPLVRASELVGASMRDCERRGRPPVVVFESTVYPGCTEELCVPVLERTSRLKCGRDFKVGYSPERINPGDPERGLAGVVKVVAGQDEETTAVLADLYSLVVRAGVHRASSIRVAEATKVIENVQRDVNIALMNELAMLFHRLGLDTHEVLRAARTKWNFLAFEPGLVGGHCIAVDPYYLLHRAQQVGYVPQLIQASREKNAAMGAYVASETVKLLIRAGKTVRAARVLVCGVSYKEDESDVRNTLVADLVRELESYEIQVEAYDPLVDTITLKDMGMRAAVDPFGVNIAYDGIVLAVPHRVFRSRPVAAYLRLLRGSHGPGVLVDVKGVLRGRVPRAQALYWHL